MRLAVSNASCTSIFARSNSHGVITICLSAIARTRTSPPQPLSAPTWATSSCHVTARRPAGRAAFILSSNSASIFEKACPDKAAITAAACAFGSAAGAGACMNVTNARHAVTSNAMPGL
jgi:hypothetical protein